MVRLKGRANVCEACCGLRITALLQHTSAQKHATGAHRGQYTLTLHKTWRQTPYVAEDYALFTST
jgi:hypothetical protein